MYKERLFELIRKEEVLIWAGAGMSMYAGYPSGNELAKRIYNSLTSSEKEIISPNLLLPDLAEEYNRLRLSVNPLIGLLKKVIESHTPTSRKYHDMIAGIPHFKTIITTNYDSLFETSYGNLAQIATSSKDISYLDNNKVHIFKVHGDFRELDKLIISKSDYLNFFNKEKDNLFWTKITESVATKNILFLGYNLEDLNITSIFDKVCENLQHHMKEAFLIVPGLASHKVNDLTRRGIKYIDSTAETFLEDLVVNLKENILTDFENNIVSPETYRKFLNLNDLIPKLKGSPESYKLQGLEGKNGKYEGKINLVLKNDTNFISNFDKFLSGEINDELIIPKDIIIQSNITIQGLKLPSSDELKEIFIKRYPYKTGKVDITFSDQFELTDISFKTFGGKKPRILLEHKNAKFQFILGLDNLPRIDISFEFLHNQTLGKIKDEIEVYTFLKHLTQGDTFTVHFEDGYQYKNQFPAFEQYSKYALKYLSYFNLLKKVEAAYSIRFNNFKITDESYDILIKVVNVLDEKWEMLPSDDYITLKLNSTDQGVFEFLMKIESDKPEIKLPQENSEEVILHGHKINLGYPVFTLLNPYISNLTKIKSGEDDFAIIKSKTKEIQLSYSKESSLKKPSELND